jgi:hypothetical protein
MSRRLFSCRYMFTRDHAVCLSTFTILKKSGFEITPPLVTCLMPRRLFDLIVYIKKMEWRRF